MENDGMSSFTVNQTASDETILKLLADWGVVRIPAYVGEEQLETLRNEFKRFFEPNAGPAITVFPDYSSGRGLEIRFDKLDSSMFPATNSLFSSDKFRSLKDRFIGANGTLCSEIYLTHDFRPDKWITGPHFDKIRTLKFFVYLKDATEKAGAFRCAPGSHKVTKKIVRDFVGRGGAIRDLPNDCPPNEVGELLPMEGPAGTLVIFDTDVFHQGGMLQPGEERMVMRGHCFPMPQLHYHPRRFSRQWLWESRLNPVRYLPRTS